MQGGQSGRRRLGAGFLLLACALCLLASLAPAGRAEATASGTLVLNGPDIAPANGDTFAVTLDLNGAASVHRVSAYVLYNPNIVQVVDADPGTGGTQVLPGPFPGGGSVTANSAAGGSIQYEYTLAGSAEASGSGTIATVQFRALRNGDAGLEWGTVQVFDGGGAPGAVSTAAASVSVGGSTTAAATDTPGATNTPGSTSTPAATDTATPAAAATGTPSSTATSAPSVSATVTRTRTPTVTRTAGATGTARPSSTPRITVVQNSNASPTLTVNQKLGVDGTASKPKSSLPDAGNNGPGPQWWRWTFFAAALMLGIAGWFFTFAIHHADRDVILLDRHDRRRRRR